MLTDRWLVGKLEIDKYLFLLVTRLHQMLDAGLMYVVVSVHTGPCYRYTGTRVSNAPTHRQM